MFVSVRPIDPCPGGLHVQLEASTGDPAPIRLRARRNERPKIIDREDLPKDVAHLKCDTCDRFFVAAEE